MMDNSFPQTNQDLYGRVKVSLPRNTAIRG